MKIETSILDIHGILPAFRRSNVISLFLFEYE